MVKRLQDRNQYATAYPNATLTPDWDMIEEIHQTYEKLNLHDHTYKWIPGHQDTKSQETDNTDILYNIRADQIASNHRGQHAGQPNWIVPIMAHTGCILYIDHVPQYGNYIPAIRRAAAKDDFYDYMQQRHGWDSDTITAIDWESFYVAVRAHGGSQIQLMKLVHDKLPTNHNKSRYSPHVKPTCYFCSEQDTFDHLCQTLCNSRSKEFRTNLWNMLYKLFKREGVPVKFANTFQSALALGWGATQDPEQLERPIPDALIAAQRTIGWTKILRGFLSKKWIEYLRRTIQEQRVEQWLYHNELNTGTSVHGDTMGPTQQRIDPSKLMSKIILIMWQAQFQLWEEHTSHVHAPVAMPIHRQRAELQAEIRAMQAYRNDVLADHRDQYFLSDVDTFAEMATVSQMRRYVSRYKPVILNSLKQASKTATQALRIPQFFSVLTKQRDSQLHLTPTGHEELPHRKHTKIRNLVIQKISGFFPPQTETYLSSSNLFQVCTL